MNEKLLLIRATRIGGHAYRYLTARPRTGRVVSSFYGGINLLFENAEAFVPVQVQSVPLHPWAIEIEEQPLRFAEGTPVSVQSGQLSVEETRIALSEAPIEDLQLPHFSAMDVAIAKRNFSILDWFVDKVRRAHPPDPFQHQLDTILVHWHEIGDHSVLLDLIGLGGGSTPSGDDVLVGLLAGMSLFEHVDDRTAKNLFSLRSGIRGTLANRTSLSSGQMLLAACDRSFPDPILALLGSLTYEGASKEEILESAERVAQLGHHSGLAMLLGLTGFRCVCQTSMRNDC